MPKPGSKHSGGAGRRKGGRDGDRYVQSYRRRKREVVFDPEARREHLRGFSDRKRQRRAFGLAMQRVKDREDRIYHRKKSKQDEMQRIVEAERQKETILEEIVASREFQAQRNGLPHDGSSDEESDAGSDSDEERTLAEDPQSILATKTYNDRKTERHWGGCVTVTTSLIDLDRPNEDVDVNVAPAEPQSNVDTEQQYAGNVQKYMRQLKNNMPSKRRGAPARRKGQNGAADMKGMGGAANLKLAQKVLSKARQKQSKGRGGSRRTKK